MANHPSRSWRRRAHDAADRWLARWRQNADTVAHMLTPAELADLMRTSFIEGFQAGRIDGPPLK